MTKTEETLLARATASTHKRSCVQHGYRTGRKNSNYGSREASALGKLVAAGLVRIVSQRSYVDAKNQYSDHWTETIYELCLDKAG